MPVLQHNETYYRHIELIQRFPFLLFHDIDLIILEWSPFPDFGENTLGVYAEGTIGPSEHSQAEALS